MKLIQPEIYNDIKKCYLTINPLYQPILGFFMSLITIFKIALEIIKLNFKEIRFKEKRYSYIMTSETNLQNKLEKLIGTENFEIKNVTFFDDGGYLYTNMKMIEKIQMGFWRSNQLSVV